MNERIVPNSVYSLQPTILKSLVDLGNAAAQKLDSTVFRLMTIRASQLNGCAFCLHMHLAEARKSGETRDRLDLLNVWHEASLYSARERAALHWVETLTLLPGRGVSDQDFAIVAGAYSHEEIVNLTAAVVTINSWNRIGVGFGFLPKIEEAKQSG